MKKTRYSILYAACCVVSMFALLFSVYAAEEEKEWEATIDFGEELERSEALAIAKEFLAYLEKSNEYHLTKYLVKEINGVWHVVFLKKVTEYEIGGAVSIRVTIDSNTGKIIDSSDQEGFYLEHRM